MAHDAQTEHVFIYVIVFVFVSSGPSAKASEEDQERTRRLADAEMHRHHLESLLDQRDREISALREVMTNTTMGDIYSTVNLCIDTALYQYKQLTFSLFFVTQQELHRRYEGTPESTKTKALQTVIDMKVRIIELNRALCVMTCVVSAYYMYRLHLTPPPPRMQKSTQWSGA